tara:strand:- start:226 stop:411 length:186 start_codon:yes stop_codon:yes gene_type:complete
MQKTEESDLTTILEIARIACAYMPEIICEDMDISDEEFIRIRAVINRCVIEPKEPNYGRKD